MKKNPVLQKEKISENFHYECQMTNTQDTQSNSPRVNADE